MKILLLGADGQLGYELHRTCAPLGDILPFTISGKLPGGQRCGQVDFAEPGVLSSLVAEHRPQLVLNAVAHTAVDRAEDEPALAQRINAEAVGELARPASAWRPSSCISRPTTSLPADPVVRSARTTRPVRQGLRTTKLAGEQACATAAAGT